MPDPIDPIRPTQSSHPLISSEQAATLEKIATGINARDRRHTALAVANGFALRKAKKILGHGQFANWCRRETGYELRTAQNLMSLAELAQRDNAVSGLGLTVVYRIASPSTPKEIVDLVLQRARRGEKVSIGQVEKLLVRTASPRTELIVVESVKATKPDGYVIAGIIASELGAEQARRLSALLDALEPSAFDTFKSELRKRLRPMNHGRPPIRTGDPVKAGLSADLM